jgi:hypothetical protein
MSSKIFTVAGAILSKGTDEPLEELRVEAWDKNMIKDELLGTDVTTEFGKFSITFSKNNFKDLFFNNRPDIYFKIYKEEKLVHTTEDNIDWDIENDKKDIKIFIEDEKFIVAGAILSKGTDEPLEGLRVEAWDKNMIKDELLGTDDTTEFGKFSITFWKIDFKALFSNNNPDVYFKIYKEEKLVHSIEDNIYWNIENDKKDIKIFIEDEGKLVFKEALIDENNLPKIVQINKLDPPSPNSP